MFEKFLKAKDQGVDKDFSFQITFVAEDKLKGKQLKRAIDDYHLLLPGTTKQIKAKVSEDSPTATMLLPNWMIERSDLKLVCQFSKKLIKLNTKER